MLSFFRHKSTDFEILRKDMVQKQIIARGIRDPAVLKAMSEVPRHEFVPPEYLHSAYDDHALPIGYDQTISQPYIVALMTECLFLNKEAKVLEIGTGSGYQAAILSRICKEVYTIEVIEELAKEAKKRFQKLGYANIKVRVGDGHYGWKEAAPFDGIIITCATPTLPKELEEQLAEGGRMVIPIGKWQWHQTLKSYHKQGGHLRERSITGVVFVPMVKKGDITAIELSD